MSSLIELTTEDNKVIKIDKRISQFSELFHTLIENYGTKINKSLPGITENDLNLLITFCEACNYVPIKFNTPLWKKSFKIHYDDIIKKNKKLEKFYEELTCDNLLKCLKISYFYESTYLKEFVYFKIYDVFNDEAKFKEYFKDKDKDTIEQILKISDEKKSYLYNEYNDFIEKQVKFFSKEEIDNHLMEYFP